MARVTKNSIAVFVNQWFVDNDISHYRVIMVETTRYRPEEYAAGAARIIIRVEDTSHDHYLTKYPYFVGYMSMQEMTDLTQSGYKMVVKKRAGTPASTPLSHIPILELDLEREG